MESEFVTIKQAAEITGEPYTEIARRLQLGELTRVPWESVPEEERRGRSRTYIIRAELLLPRSLEERNGWLTCKEAAELLGIQMQLLRYRVRAGHLTAHRMETGTRRKGWKFYFSREEVEKAREQQFPRPVAAYDYRPTLTEIVYLAGFIDGEGSIIIYRKPSPNRAISDQYMVKLFVTNTDQAVLQWIADRFGGSVQVQARAKHGCKATFTWQSTACTSYEVLKRVSPYLLVKRKQALLAIEFQERLTAYNASRWHPFSPDETNWRKEQQARIAALNRRGSDNG